MSTPIKTVAEIKPGALFTFADTWWEVVREVNSGEVVDGSKVLNTKRNMFWCKKGDGGPETGFCFTEPIDSRITDFRMP